MLTPENTACLKLADDLRHWELYTGTWQPARASVGIHLEPLIAALNFTF
jgi:hypothetical protein